MTRDDPGPEASVPEEDIESFRQAVRDTAYFLWEEAGQPDGRADEFWFKAIDTEFRHRAYGMWMQAMERNRSRDPEDVAEAGDAIGDDETLALARATERERDA